MNSSHQKEWGTLLEAVALIIELTGATPEGAALIFRGLFEYGRIRYRNAVRTEDGEAIEIARVPFASETTRLSFMRFGGLERPPPDGVNLLDIRAAVSRTTPANIALPPSDPPGEQRGYASCDAHYGAIKTMLARARAGRAPQPDKAEVV